MRYCIIERVDMSSERVKNKQAGAVRLDITITCETWMQPLTRKRLCELLMTESYGSQAGRQFFNRTYCLLFHC